MATYYADTSALVKRHLPEPGSVWFQALAAPAACQLIITARISLVESYSVLNRRVRERVITIAEYQRISVDLDHVWLTEYQIVELTTDVIENARRLLERHPLRAYDAVQLASATQARRILQAASVAAPIFLSADNGLLAAARAEGFSIDNPNLH